jgi:predicted P-loop ATPase
MEALTMSRPDWLQKYLDRGFKLIFYPGKQKGPVTKNWATAAFNPDDWTEGMNVGVILGTEIAEGRYLLDVDLDWQDGAPMVKRLLKPTGFGFGRGERKVTHAFYTADEAIPSISFDDIDGKPLVELRGTKADGSLGFQTMIPPSIHPSGDIVTLRVDGEIAHDAAIVRHITLYAIACLFLKHFGHRGFVHEQRLAVAGFLLQVGLTEQEVTSICQAVVEMSGNDAQDMGLVLKTTFERHKANEKVAGSGVLAKLLGDDGKKIVSRVREWLGEKEFVTGKGDAISANSQENIIRALEKLKASLVFDEFSQKPLLTWNGRTTTLEDHQALDLWLTVDRRFGFRPSKEFFFDMLLVLARQNTIHPVRDYLRTLEWDGVNRIGEWLIRYGGAADTEFVRTVSRIVLVAAVRRVMRPGCKFDELLVLESNQGQFKSSALRALCPIDNWFSDDLPLDVDAKQLIERTQGKWIIEAAELSGMRSSLREHLKSMLSRQVDGPVRMAYGRLPVEQPRQFITIGTTNDHFYLSDPTGNRRFWPVRVSGFDVPALKADRDQLWAEAVHLEAEGFSIRLPEELYDHAGIQQERRREVDPWEDIIVSSFNGEMYQRLSPDELWADILGIPIERRSSAYQMRVSKIMQKLGFRRMAVKGKDGKVVKGWARGEGKRDPVRLEGMDYND